jgi:hypothetical protein
LRFFIGQRAQGQREVQFEFGGELRNRNRMRRRENEIQIKWVGLNNH